MEISIIVAASDNNIIGKDNRLLWRLSNDMKHFKALTMGHPVIMGRKTFESIGKPLPGRKNIIITRNTDYVAEGCIIVNNIYDAIKEADEADEVFVIGGDQIYKQYWNKAAKLYLTRVHVEIEGDVSIPSVENSVWREINCTFHKADEKNEYDHSVITYIRK